MSDFDLGLTPAPRADPRDRQGPRPPCVGGRARGRRRAHLDRQARLGARPPSPPTCDGSSDVLRDKPVVIGGTFFEVVYVKDKLDEYKSWLQGLGLVARRDLRRDDRDSAGAKARAGRRLRARLHRPVRGGLEGWSGRVQHGAVGAVAPGGARRRRLEGDHRGARGRHCRDLRFCGRHAHPT